MKHAVNPIVSSDLLSTERNACLPSFCETNNSATLSAYILYRLYQTHYMIDVTHGAKGCATLRVLCGYKVVTF